MSRNLALIPHPGNSNSQTARARFFKSQLAAETPCPILGAFRCRKGGTARASCHEHAARPPDASRVIRLTDRGSSQNVVKPPPCGKTPYLAETKQKINFPKLSINYSNLPYWKQSNKKPAIERAFFISPAERIRRCKHRVNPQRQDPSIPYSLSFSLSFSLFHFFTLYFFTYHWPSLTVHFSLFTVHCLL